MPGTLLVSAHLICDALRLAHVHIRNTKQYVRVRLRMWLMDMTATVVHRAAIATRARGSGQYTEGEALAPQGVHVISIRSATHPYTRMLQEGLQCSLCCAGLRLAHLRD